MQQRMTTETFALLNSMTAASCAAAVAAAAAASGGSYDPRFVGKSAIEDYLHIRSNPLSFPPLKPVADGGLFFDGQISSSPFWNSHCPRDIGDHDRTRQLDDNARGPMMPPIARPLPVDIVNAVVRRSTPYLIRDILGLGVDADAGRGIDVEQFQLVSTSTVGSVPVENSTSYLETNNKEVRSTLVQRRINSDKIVGWNGTVDSTSMHNSFLSSTSRDDGGSLHNVEHVVVADTTRRGNPISHWQLCAI
jgi:hypothetical protein